MKFILCLTYIFKSQQEHLVSFVRVFVYVRRSGQTNGGSEILLTLTHIGQYQKKKIVEKVTLNVYNFPTLGKMIL